MAFSDFVKFPIWKNDGKAIIPLNNLQKKQIDVFLQKVENKEYNYIDNPCLCGNNDKYLDVLVAEKDRFGIPSCNVLCKKCGLIRVDKRLDDKSTGEFYKNEYRDIYIGKELASEQFFNGQLSRGNIFLSLVAKYLGLENIETAFEVGCGAGGVLYPFHNKGIKTSGCDFGEQYLIYGKEQKLDLYQGEIDYRKTPKNSQDLVIVSHVMEHFNEPLKTMGEIIEIVSPGKYLLLEVPGVFYSPEKAYINQILYFQNAHVHNYYYCYLIVFFGALGLDVIYGDEKCTFLLKKPNSWKRENNPQIDAKKLAPWVKKVDSRLRMLYFIHIFKLSPYYYKRGVISLLEQMALKNIVKKMLS